MLEDLKNRKADVGWFNTSKYSDGTPVAYVASIQEFGYAAKNIPPRPFIRPTIAEEEATWRNLIARGAKAIAKGTTNTHDVLTQIGGKASGDIRKAISRVTSPELKDETIAARKRKMADKKTTGSLTKPLVFTKTLINSPTFIVSDGNV
jgi:hypothetical protein